jgi:hypothetical protein
MQATTLYLANGQTRTVRGDAQSIGGALKARSMSGDDGLRQFQTTDGDWITINRSAVLLAEGAGTHTTRQRVGFTWIEDES